MEVKQLKVVFFDLGDTLVEKDPSSPGELKFRWLSGARNTLLALAGAGLRVGLISNTGTFGRDDLSRALPADFRWSLFDAHLVLLSSEVKLLKPDLRIFRLALRRSQEHDNPEEALRTNPQQCLFCGESIVETLAAQLVGIRAARMLSGVQSDVGGLVDKLREARLLP